MSKYVKDLIVNDLKSRLAEIDSCVIANVIGLNAEQTVRLRKQLRDKDIHILVVKNSLVARATEGTPLASGFEGLSGTSAVAWGAEDFVSLVKEITALDGSEDYKAFAARGGVMEGEPLTAERVKEISTWPSRGEQLSILAGQLTAPWRLLQSQLTGPGGSLASQVEKKSKE
jgi:ribosomal protein L10